MAGEKIFIGPKLRELRIQRNLTQAQLAKLLGVSSSYVNLVEHNQRSASFKFLVTLTEHFGLSWQDVTNTDQKKSLADLRRICADPAFGDSKPDIEELRSALDGAPNLVAGFLNIFNTYQNFAERLAEYGEVQSSRGSTLSIEQGVHDFFRNHNNYFAELEACAEQCYVQEMADRNEFYSALSAHLKNKLGVRIEHVENQLLQATLSKYDAGNKCLYISDALDHRNTVFHLAH